MTAQQDAGTPRRRSDAERNAVAVLEAARELFAEVGVDAPMRSIAARAGVGVGTVYRRFPQRSDLIIAVFRHELEATAADAERLGDELPPPEALRAWTRSLAGFVAAKQGFGSALHSGDPAYAALPEQFLGLLAEPVQRILDRGASEGSLRPGLRAEDLIVALSHLIDPERPDEVASETSMIRALVDGLAVLPPGHASMTA